MGTDDIGKKRKVENKRLRSERKEAKRSVGNRSLIPKILILTEGYSEEIYFKKLVELLSLNTVEVQKSTHTDSDGIVKNASTHAKGSKRAGDEYSFIFCIFDLDTVRNRNFLNTISTYKTGLTEIIPVYSFPCIEIWFILHFEVCTKPFHSKDKKSIGDTVKEYFTKNYVENYSEMNTESIEQLVHLYKRAIHNARQLAAHQTEVDSNNPITTIHNLVILLDNIFNRTNNYMFERTVESFIEAKI